MSVATNPVDTPVYSQIDDEDMRDLLELFASELPDRAQRMTDAWSQRDVATVKTLAHQLKGAGGGYGFPDLSTVAANLEALCKEERLDQIGPAIEATIAFIRRVRV